MSKLVLLNKDRDKPKRGSFKRPTLHIPNVTHHAKKQRVPIKTKES